MNDARHLWNSIILASNIQANTSFHELLTGVYTVTVSAVTRALIGGGGGINSYIRDMPDEFLLKSIVFKLISKEITRAEHDYMKIHPPPPPPPINALATALMTVSYLSNKNSVLI